MGQFFILYPLILFRRWHRAEDVFPKRLSLKTKPLTYIAYLAIG